MVMPEGEGFVCRLLVEGNYKKLKLAPFEKPHMQLKKLAKNINRDTWITSDIHLTSNDSRAPIIIERINDTVGYDGHLLILGDLGKAYNANQDRSWLASAMKNIHTPNKYLILGNHDVYGMDEYVAMGFDQCVTDELTLVIENIKIRFSHFPLIVPQDTVNIHGHIHGNNTYYEMSRIRHYDTYIKWDTDYIRHHIVRNEVKEGFPALNQLGDFLDNFDIKRCD